MQHYTAEMDQSSIEELISLVHSHINFLFALFFNKTCLNNQSSKMYFIIVLNQITSTVTIQQAAVILKKKQNTMIGIRFYKLIKLIYFFTVFLLHAVETNIFNVKKQVEIVSRMFILAATLKKRAYLPTN